MAEAIAVVGLTSSILQFVSFSSEVIKRLHDFESSLNESPNVFHELITTLPLLKDILQRLCSPITPSRRSEQTEEVLMPVVRECVSQVKLLEELLKKTIPTQDDTSSSKRWKALCSLAREKTVKQAVQRLRNYSDLLAFHQSICTSDIITQVYNRVITFEDSKLIPEPHPTRQDSDRLKRLDSEEITSQEEPERSGGSGLESITRPPRQAKSLHIDSVQPGARCLNDKCLCSCHTIASKSGRFWVCKVPSLAGLFSACNRKSCRNRVVRASYRISLSRFNILWAIQLSLGLAWGESGCSISPVLRTDRIVKYTSPGFTLLWQSETGQIKWPEAGKKLQRLFAENEASPFDVDPKGGTWLEKLLRYPWNLGTRGAQFGLLEMLLQQGAKRDTNESLLYLCATWIGEGPHLSAVELLLHHQYDLSTVNSHSLLKWPQGSNPNWLGEGITPDPFFIELVRKCVENDPGFGETTSLMDAVLTSSEEMLSQRLRKSPALLERNFLGQSALHHAILRPKHLRQLIPHYETVDLPDKWGITPLMYAATYDKVESVLLLLDAGADLSRRDELWRRNFLDFALEHDNWGLITGVVEYFKHHSDANASQHVLNYIMHQFVNSWKNHMGEGRVQELLCLGADPNMNLNDGATLLHRVRDFDAAKALFDAGFTLINHPDKRGITPLMRVVKLGNAALVQACIDRGASVNQQDHKGWSALHHIAKELQSSTYFHSDTSPGWHLTRHSELITTVRLLLQQGANPAATDHCLCPCSLSGCTASTILLGTHRYSIFSGEGNKWSLEWLQILSELASDSTGEQTLQDLVRVEQFKEHDLTHVCCRTGGYSRVEDDDIDEILDEQSHGIQELEEMMERYSEGRRGDLEERWIEQLARLRVIRGGNKAFTNDSRNTDDDWGSKSWYTYEVDSSQDCFREFMRVPSSLGIPQELNMRDYFIWLEHYYNHRADFSTSTPIDEDWYRTRKSWASRLETALEAAST